MKVLIVSDTHGSNSLYAQLCKKYAPLDMVIHCGDIEGYEEELKHAAGCPVVMVAGNNDFFSDTKKEEEITLEGHRIWITHGHNYYVSMGNDIIVDEAKSRGIEIVMYGHTHRPVIETKNGVAAINPGSLTYPRQEGRNATYIIMNIEKGKQPEFELFRLP